MTIKEVTGYRNAQDFIAGHSDEWRVLVDGEQCIRVLCHDKCYLTDADDKRVYELALDGDKVHAVEVTDEAQRCATLQKIYDFGAESLSSGLRESMRAEIRKNVRAVVHHVTRKCGMERIVGELRRKYPESFRQ